MTIKININVNYNYDIYDEVFIKMIIIVIKTIPKN